MSLKVYYDLMSQPARAVLLFLKKNSIDYTPVLIDIRRRAHLSTEFRQVNHFQRVPAIDDGGFHLSESAAILRYLSRQYPCPDHWYPQDTRARARIDQYLDWQHLNTRLNAALLFQTLVIRPRVTGQPVDQSRADFYRAELAGTLDHLEQFFLSETPFLNSERISIADLLAVCELEQPTACGFAYSAGSHPRLAAWMARVKAELAPHFDEVHRILHQVRDRFAQGKLDMSAKTAGPEPKI